MPGRTQVVRTVLANRAVCLVELAFAGFNMSEYGVWVSVLVYAYERGGTTATAIVACAQLVPAAIAAPAVAPWTDRQDPARALRRGYWWQAASLGATGLLAHFAAPELFVYAGAVLAATSVTATRPAQAALVPRLAGSPDQLTAINVVSGWVESISILAGPALAAVFIDAGGVSASIGMFALLTLASALLTGRVESPRVKEESWRDREPGGAPCHDSDLAPRSQPGVAPLVAVVGAGYLVIGMLDVLLVALAIGVLRMGPSGPGYLSAAFGAGGVLGSFATVSLIGRRRLVSPLLAAAFAWAALLVALGGWTTAIGAFVLLPAAGLARTILDVSGRTMLLHVARPDHRARVFGALEAVAMAALAMGSLSVPIFTWAGGARISLVVTGCVLAAIALTAAIPLTRERSSPARRSRQRTVPGQNVTTWTR